MDHKSVHVDHFSPSEHYLSEDDNHFIESLSNLLPIMHKITIYLKKGRKISYVYDDLNDAIMEYETLLIRPELLKACVHKYLWSLMTRSDCIVPEFGIYSVLKVDWYILNNMHKKFIFKSCEFKNPYQIVWQPTFNCGSLYNKYLIE
jgi:hypothetical protein